ncbi:hypothetical protein H8R18_00580 [Nanchangia anserum]|uniref:C-deglycosylation enzyme beta subunit n=1 Tax=Nanchangia anserum TaxID=2692125 RepID=A0A8I0GD09_9ACTO|nr:DUF6379 domain-containing protein [Nanchangia anserum]MBD3689741.1 hypothetical protein [Nanchangia anserum]QOX81912.1 hypothetical protein H8R18_00580 [Nanchangia anserum]
MPTKFMRLGFEKQTLRNLKNVKEKGHDVGWTIDVGLNYYRGTPLSAVERLELAVDGKRVDDNDILVEINGKRLRIHEVPLAFTEYWGVRTPIRLHVYGETLTPGEHDIELTLEARVVYMEFAPGVFGMFDGSARATMTVEE